MEKESLKEINYNVVEGIARIAIYDDMKSSPRIVEVKGEETKTFIGNLSAEVYRLSKEAGGRIAYSVIKQLCENFIHANFCEMVISIMDNGNVIKFTDQGPGINNKEQAILPGFSSATKEMKKFIDGVGSGLPIANEYIKSSLGSLKIEDNIKTGTVITLSLTKKEDYQQTVSFYETAKNNSLEETNKNNKNLSHLLSKEITDRGKIILTYLSKENIAGVKDIAEEFSWPKSSVHSEFKKLEDLNLIKKTGTKRSLSNFGENFINQIQ